MQVPDGQIEDLPPAWDPTNSHFAVSMWVRELFKWSHYQAKFSAVFSGSNDRDAVANQETITEYLRQVATFHPVSLLSVIGGNYFLDLLAEVPFSRVVLFDENVAEFAKLTSLLNIWAEDPKRDPFPELERLLVNDPRSLMPWAIRSQVTYQLGPRARWQYQGSEGPTFPALLTHDQYPNYAWDPSVELRVEIFKRLKSSLSQTVYTDLPYLDANGHLVVVFCSNSNLEDLPDAVVKSRITNAAGVIVLRAIVSPNDSALDPHPYWEAIARSALNGLSHQVWAPENAWLLRSEFDHTTNTSSILSRDPIPTGTVTILTHHLLGNCTGNIEDRQAEVSQFLQHLPDTVQRVVIAEYRPEGDHGSTFGFTSTDELSEFYTRILPGFEFTEIRYAPGAHDVRRNLFLIFNRAT